MKRNFHILPFVVLVLSVSLWSISGPVTRLWERSATTVWSWCTLSQKPPVPDIRWLGIYRPEAPYSVDILEKLAGETGAKFRIVSLYQAWGSDSASAFPVAELEAIRRYDAYPMVTWEPWLSGFKSEFRDMRKMELLGLRRIAQGDFDPYLRHWAREAFEWGKPMFLRFAHEMDNATQYPWTTSYANTPSDFIAAWKHVHQIFLDEGARNVAWVWSPRDAHSEEYYPGADALDWVATTVFNYGAYSSTPWPSFNAIFSEKYKMLRRFGKPIMIGELGCTMYGGDQNGWYREAFANIRGNYSDVKAVVLFQHPADRTSHALIDWSFSSQLNPDVLKEAVSQGTFERAQR